MGCASSAPSSARLRKKQKDKRDPMNNVTGYNDAVANIFDEAGNTAGGAAEGVVSFFAETSFRKLSDEEDYMKSRILDPTRKTTNKFLDKSTTWAPDAGDYLEKKLVRDKTRFETKLVEEKDRKDKERKEKEEKKLKAPFMETQKLDKKKIQRDRINTIKRSVKKTRKGEPDIERASSPGDSLLDAIAVVHARAKKDKMKRVGPGRKMVGMATTDDLKEADETKTDEENGQVRPERGSRREDDDVESLDIASSRLTLKQSDSGRNFVESPISSASDTGTELKVEDFKMDSASMLAESLYETETELEHDEDIYDDAGISASSVSLDDLLSVASDDDVSSDVGSISTIADRRGDTYVPAEKVRTRNEEPVDKAQGKTETREGA